MNAHEKQNANEKFEAVSAAELVGVSGGIWDYSNRLGPYLGQQLEDRQDGKYGVSFTPKNLDDAASRALQGWVSVP